MDRTKNIATKTLDTTASMLSNPVITDALGTVVNVASKGKIDAATSNEISKAIGETASAYDTNRKTGGCHRIGYKNIILIAICIVLIVLIFATRTYQCGSSCMEKRELNKLYTY